MDDYEEEDDAGASSGLKKLSASLGLKLRPWEGGGGGVRSAKSEVSLIDFTDDSFSSTTPSPLTECRPLDDDTLKVGDVFLALTDCRCLVRSRFWSQNVFL